VAAMDAFLDAVLNIVTTMVFIVVAIPLFAMCIGLFYAPIYVSLPILFVIAAVGSAAWRVTSKRRRPS
jgi:ABC-type transport system involved in Fe-S cluster assembly fused permease/ATPase subunit